MPYIEETSLYSQINFQKPMLDPALVPNSNAAVIRTKIGTYLCPSTGRRYTTRLDSDFIGDVNGNGKTTDLSEGEGMACIDYAGLDGDTSNASYLNPNTGKMYPAYVDTSQTPNVTVTGVAENGILRDSNVSENVRPVKIRQITDGTSYTMMIAEVTGRGVFNGSSPDLRGVWAAGQNVVHLPSTQLHNGVLQPWINPDPKAGTPTGSGNESAVWSDAANVSMLSDHSGGAQCMMCDGSALFVNENISVSVLLSLVSRDGGESLAVPPF